MKITTKLLLAFLLISLVPLTAISVLSYSYAEEALTQEVLHHLESVGAIQQSRVESIVDQNLERLVLVSSRTQLRLSLESFLSDPKSEYQDTMNRILLDARSSIGSFEDISVLTLDGKTVASTDMARIGTEHSDEEFFTRGQKENSADIFFLDENENLRVYLSGPLYLDNTLLGVVVIESDVDNVISLVSDYSGLGETGETVLAKRDVHGDALFIAPLRFDPHAALNRTVSKDDLGSPITQALLKKEQLFVDAVDYDGHSVLAATRYVEKTDWGLVVSIDRTEAFAPIIQLRDLLALIVFVSSIVVTFTSLYIARSITRPIINLTQVASKISEGDLSRRAEVTSTNEIGILARALNQMAENLIEDITERERAEEELRKHREQLEHLVEERTAELAIAKGRAEEADRLKSVFLATMSHELRTPLNSIIGFTGILLQGLAGEPNEEQKKQLGMVYGSAKHLLALINDVLDISKIEAGQVELMPSQFAVSAPVQEVVKALTPMAKAKGLEMTVSISPQVGEIYSDRRRVEQILLNLVNNAIKFTEQGEVHIEAQIVDRHLQVSVQDTGMGIKKEDMGKLFQPFRQIGNSGQRRYEGTGLGLNICKRLVDLMGGRIWVESEYGVGSRFTFTLPPASEQQEARVHGRGYDHGNDA